MSAHAAGTAELAEPLPAPVAAAQPGGVGRSSLVNLLFVLPFILLLLALIVVPVGLGVWLSFQDYDMLSGYEGPVGFANYANLLTDRVFLKSLRNTMLFVLMATPTFVALGLFLALALNNRYRSSTVLRSIFFGSSVLSVTVVTLIWRLVYLPERGLLADLLAPFGLPAPDIVANPRLALPGVAVVTVWWIIGLPMTLFLAGLQQIPPEIYEAAALDNASRWRTLVFVTLPQLRRTIVLVAVIEVILQFQVFGQILLITGGGPDNASKPIVQFIYEAGFRDWQLGFASAASQVLFALMMLASFAQMWLGRRPEGR
jgi:multiple sugar transport system permease protein